MKNLNILQSKEMMKLKKFLVKNKNLNNNNKLSFSYSKLRIS